MWSKNVMNKIPQLADTLRVVRVGHASSVFMHVMLHANQKHSGYKRCKANQKQQNNCWTHFESYNFPTLTPVKFAFVTLFEGVLQLIMKTRFICTQIVTQCGTT